MDTPPFELIVTAGRQAGRTFAPADGQTLTIGRVPPCDIVIDDQSISRRHCSVTRQGTEITITDLGSANGTYVNEERIDAATLRRGDIIRVGGSTVECRSPAPPSGAVPRLAIRTEDGGMQSVIRRQIEPSRIDLVRGAPDAKELDLLRRAERHLHTVHTVSDLLSRSTDVESLFDSIVTTILDVTGGDRAAVLVRRQDDPAQVTLAASRTPRGAGLDTQFVVSRSLVNDVLENGVSTFTLDATSDTRYSAGESVIQQRIKSVMCVPLRTTDAILGALYVDTQRAIGRFGEAELELLAAVGNQAGIALHRARLLADLERMFLDTIKAIAATIDAKDGYTHRHSERVAAFAKRLAGELGLSKEDQEIVELSSLLHDVGKIGVPDSILNKPGSLTPEEFEEMKKHPVHGARIVSNIHGPRVNALLPGVRNHHERWDGTGYPDGLHGDDIPLLGRILGVADFLDALTSARAYRAPLSLDEVIALLQKGAGQHFDPKVVEAATALHARGELALPAEPSPALA